LRRIQTFEYISIRFKSLPFIHLQTLRG